jgi:hypothetical protein
VRFGEGLVAGDGDGRAFFPHGEHLEEPFGAAPVEFHVSELIRLGLTLSAPALARVNEARRRQEERQDSAARWLS